MLGSMPSARVVWSGLLIQMMSGTCIPLGCARTEFGDWGGGRSARSFSVMHRGWVQPGPVGGGFGDRWARGGRMVQSWLKMPLRCPWAAGQGPFSNMDKASSHCWSVSQQKCTTCFLLTPVHKLIRRHKPFGQGPVADPQGSAAPPGWLHAADLGVWIFSPFASKTLKPSRD